MHKPCKTDIKNKKILYMTVLLNLIKMLKKSKRLQIVEDASQWHKNEDKKLIFLRNNVLTKVYSSLYSLSSFN